MVSVANRAARPRAARLFGLGAVPAARNLLPAFFRLKLPAFYCGVPAGVIRRPGRKGRLAVIPMASSK